MRHATGTTTIAAPAAIIREALVSATQLPEWNPAFVRVGGPTVATVDVEYELETIMGRHGSLTYTRIEPDRIVMTWRVPLLRERGTWLIEEHGPAHTRVTHSVERHGALVAAIAHTLGTLPQLRLDRLTARAREARLL
ncbi:SRPBCC family protein [Microbacterium sp.]|uniref:SRPBCC family protein n=1 Tax=Microbacterium sp. TaxID=51671 RepID=UPI003C70E937